MSEPPRKTVAELFKELGLDKVARPDCVGYPKLAEAMRGIGGAFARSPYVQSSLVDHARASAGRPMDAGEQMRAAVHDALEARGLELIGPPTITLMTHDEIIAEAPVANLFTVIDNIKGNHGRSPWVDHAPGDILADINTLAKKLRDEFPTDPHQATANAMGISRQEAKGMNFGMPYPIGGIVPIEFEQLPPQNSDLAFAREYTLGHFHRNTPPQASINCRCYADFRIVIGHADHDTDRYEDGEEITRAPWRMPRIRIAGRRIDPWALGWLAVVFDNTPGKKNRHTARRWLRRFRTLVDVASDALRESNRPRAIEVLAEMIGVQEAIDLTTPHVSIRSYWTGSLASKPAEYHASSVPFAQLIGRLKRDHPQIADWEQALADLPPNPVVEIPQPNDDTEIVVTTESVGVAREGFGVPILRSGVVALSLTQEDYKPTAGEPVFVNTLGQVVPPAHSPGPAIGRFVGPGDSPGTMLVRFGAVDVELSGVDTANFAPGMSVALTNSAGAFDVETHSVKPGLHTPMLHAYAEDDARLTLELAKVGQAVASRSGAVLTPDGWRVTCGVCLSQVAEEDMASRELYPVGICVDCYLRSCEGKSEPVE